MTHTQRKVKRKLLNARPLMIIIHYSCSIKWVSHDSIMVDIVLTNKEL